MFRSGGFSIVLALVAAASDIGFAQPEDVRCNYSRRIDCSAAGCQNGVVGAQYLLLPRLEALRSATIRAKGVADLPTIRRCDAKGCAPVTVRATLSGAFTNIAQYDGAYFLKVASVDLGDLGPPVGDFVEVNSLFLGTITYFGSCNAVTR
jgi:hypothetical protein